MLAIAWFDRWAEPILKTALSVVYRRVAPPAIGFGLRGRGRPAQPGSSYSLAGTDAKLGKVAPGTARRVGRMEIIGIGTDIVECPRIGRMIEEYGELFLRRIYT